MPLGYGGYGDFDMSGYEDALMKLAGVQRNAQQTSFADFLKILGPVLQSIQERKRLEEQQTWERGIKEQELGQRGEYYDYQQDMGEQKFEFEQGQWPTQKAYIEAQTNKMNQPPRPPAPTAAETNWQRDIENIRRNLSQREAEVYGPHQAPGDIAKQAWQGAYDRKYGEEPEKPPVSRELTIGTAEFERLYQSAIKPLIETASEVPSREKFL